MKVIKNKIIPPRGYSYINLFGVLFTRSNRPINDVTLNHESIHSKQMREMLYVPFYLWYAAEWLVKLICYKDSHKAYRAVSFEREAYDKQADFNYLNSRKHYRWISYLK